MKWLNNVRMINRVMLVLMILAVVLAGNINWRAEDSERYLTGEVYGEFAVVDALRQTSDDLTRMARSYAVTGEERYREYFDEILDIRNGAAPRPEVYYEQPYWEIVTAGQERPSAPGETVALRELVRQGAMLDGEDYALLDEAEDRSNELVMLERAVMEVIAAEREANGGEHVLRGAALEAMLQLHGQEYHDAKYRIMAPLYEMVLRVTDRVRETGMRLLLEAFVTIGALMLVLALTVIFGVIDIRNHNALHFALNRRTLPYALMTLLALVSIVLMGVEVAGASDRGDEIGGHVFRHGLADGLRQSSDDLTRMARLHAITGEERYREHFDEILAIRNGEAGVPRSYYAVPSVPYWDFMLANVDLGDRHGVRDAEPLAGIAARYFSAGEIALLNESEAQSNDLVVLENEAMDLVAAQGEANGEHRVEGDVLEAVMRLHGDGYHGAKLRVMQPLADLVVLVDEHSREAAAREQGTLESLTQVVLLLMALGLVMSAVIVVQGIRHGDG